MSIKWRRWAHEDRCRQLADARAVLARQREADRIYARIIDDLEEARCAVSVVAVSGAHPGILLGTIRLARKHQGRGLPRLVSEKLVERVVMVEVLASSFDEACAAVAAALGDRDFSL